MSSDEPVVVDDTREGPFVGEPIVESRYIHYSVEPGQITICDEQQPFAWITSDAYVTFGGIE